MSSRFRLIATPNFKEQVRRLPANVFKQLQVRLNFLASNPRHPSLQTHEVIGKAGH